MLMMAHTVRRVVKKGLLQVTRTVLDFRVAGNFKLVWVMIAITGMAYAGVCHVCLC